MKNFNSRYAHGLAQHAHTWIACIHSHTSLQHHHSYNLVVRSASSAITEFGIKFLF